MCNFILKKVKNFFTTHLKISAISLLFNSLTSCENTVNNTSKDIKTAALSNIKIELSQDCILEESNGVAKYFLRNNFSDTIKIFHFGISDGSVEQNIARWENQLDSVHSSSTSWKQTISFTEIRGIQKGKKVYSFGVIMPSTDGPYFLKSITNKEKADSTRSLLKSIIEGAVYE